MSEASFNAVGDRVAAFIHQLRPKHASKFLQSTFDLNQRTAERILAGEVSNRNLEKMIQVWGKSFAQFALAPLVGNQSIVTTEVPAFIWFTPEGTHFSTDADEFIARQLGMKSRGDDLKSYAQRNLGYVLASRSLNTVSLHYAEHGVDSKALYHAGVWLADQNIPCVLIEIEKDGQWVRKSYPVSEAMEVLEASARLSDEREGMIDLSWSIERKSLDNVIDLQFVRFLKARGSAQNSAQLLKLIAQLDLLPNCALFRECQENIVSIHAGHMLGVKASEVVGRNLMDRPDRAYAELVRSHLLEAAHSPEPTYHDLTLPIDGRWFAYERIATVSKPDENGARLIASLVNVKQGRAAA